MDMLISRSKQHGFTLVEVIVVITVIALLGVVALNSLVSSTDTFSFLSKYKTVQSSLRTARNLAMTNANIVSGGVEVNVDRYGVLINKGRIRVFADLGVPFELDALDEYLQDKDFNFDNTKYELIPRNSGPFTQSSSDLILPVVFYYERGTGEFSAFEDVNGTNDIVPKQFEKFVSVEFTQKETDPLKKYIMIFQVAGLPEEVNALP